MGQKIGGIPPLHLVTQAPNGRIYLNNQQLNIPNSAQTTILLDTVDPLFTDGIEDTVNHKITPGIAGWYLYTASICWNSVIDQKRYDLEVLRTGAIGVGADSFCASGGIGVPDGNFNNYRKVTDVIYLTAAQSLYLVAYHVDGTNNPDIKPGKTLTFLTVQRVR